MPISVPGTCKAFGVPQRRADGYTLIELLVVLIVLGLCAGLVYAIATPDDRARLEFDSDRLEALLMLAGTEARLTGKQLTWTSDGRAYRFHRYDEDGAVREPGAHDPLRPRTFAAGVSVGGLTIEGTTRQRLQIDFLPHAPPRVFELRLNGPHASSTISGDPLGEIETHVHAQAH